MIGNVRSLFTNFRYEHRQLKSWRSPSTSQYTATKLHQGEQKPDITKKLFNQDILVCRDFDQGLCKTVHVG